MFLLSLFVIIASQAQQQQYYTGNGGKGISLTIYVPQSTGLAKDQSYIPALVQGEFVSNFSNYSAISILDWERLDDIYVKLVSEAYDDKAAAKQDVVLGRLAPTSHFLTGNITKTAKGYNIKMNITATTDKMVAAAYTGTFTFAELDNLTGIRRASLELLQKVGVELTDKARQELAGAAEANQISAQTALAKGVTAQRQGTEVEALSYYYQAASFNPALKEAVNRSSVMAANISTGNIGADARNDIAWRKRWVARLKETEETFYKIIDAADPPYTLYYSTTIQKSNIDYQEETLDLSIDIILSANMAWFDALYLSLGAAKAVLTGLDATNRRSEWGLDGWPQDGMSNTNPFTSKEYNFTVVFELVNERGRTIGRKTIGLTPSFYVTINDILFENTKKTVKFNGVKADDISDNLTIRIASVNEAPPQNARFAIISKVFAEKVVEEQMSMLSIAKEKALSNDFLNKGGALKGGRDITSIMRVVEQNMAALRYAYNKRLREKPGLTGQITVKFAIDEFGKVIFTQVVGSTMNDSELESTVVSRLKSWNFEKIDKPGDVTEVTYPFVFSS